MLRKRLLKSGSISLAWALLCLRNFDAAFMQSGLFVVLHSLKLAGCAFNDVRWYTMIADAALRLIVSEPQTLFTTGCSLPGVLPFSVCFLFFIYWICFPLFSALLFCWRLIQWLLHKPNSTSDVLWNKFARVWMEIPDCKSKAIDLDSNMEVNKRWK